MLGTARKLRHHISQPAHRVALTLGSSASSCAVSRSPCIVCRLSSDVAEDGGPRSRAQCRDWSATVASRPLTRLATPRTVSSLLASSCLASHRRREDHQRATCFRTAHRLRRGTAPPLPTVASRPSPRVARVLLASNQPSSRRRDATNRCSETSCTYSVAKLRCHLIALGHGAPTNSGCRVGLVARFEHRG